jgi:hypothetical protein
MYAITAPTRSAGAPRGEREESGRGDASPRSRSSTCPRRSAPGAADGPSCCKESGTSTSGPAPTAAGRWRSSTSRWTPPSSTRRCGASARKATIPAQDPGPGGIRRRRLLPDPHSPRVPPQRRRAPNPSAIVHCRTRSRVSQLPHAAPFHRPRDADPLVPPLRATSAHLRVPPPLSRPRSDFLCLRAQGNRLVGRAHPGGP